jgi:lysozyme
MNIRELRKTLEQSEGLSLKPYRCPAGKLSIGYGRNLDDNGIRQEEADLMLDNDIRATVKELTRILPNWRLHNDARQNVLLDMLFNLGAPRFLRFKKMLAALEKFDYTTAAAEMLDSLWARQVKGRAQRLAEQMRTGKFGESS